MAVNASPITFKVNGWGTVSHRLAGVFSNCLAEDFEEEIKGNVSSVTDADNGSHPREADTESRIEAWRCIERKFCGVFRDALVEEMKLEAKCAARLRSRSRSIDSSTCDGGTSLGEVSDLSEDVSEGEFGDDEGYSRPQRPRRLVPHRLLEFNKRQARGQVNAWRTVGQRLADVISLADLTDEEE